MLTRLRDTKVSTEEMADMLTVITYEPSVLKTWLLALDNISTYGATELFKDYPSEARAIGITQDILDTINQYNNNEPWLIPRVRDAYKSVIRTQFCLKMNNLDDLTQIGAIAFADDSEFADDWRLYNNSDVWTAWADQKGNNAIVFGAVKRGKTNFALLDSEMFMAKGRQVISTISVPNPPESYQYCPNLSSMLITICESKLKKKRIVGLFDEGMLYWNKIQTVMPKNIDLDKLVYCYGKMDLNLIYIGHVMNRIPGSVVQSSVAEFEKMSVKNVRVTIREGVKMRSRVITSVPPTTLAYSPEQFQYFSIDMNVQDLFEFFSKIPEGANQWELTLDYVKKHRGEASEAEVEPKRVAKFLKTKGMSVSEISEAIDEPRSTVGNWTKSEE